MVFRNVQRQLDLKTEKEEKKKKNKSIQQHPSFKRQLVVILNVEQISEAVARTLRKYDVHVGL